MKIIRLKKGDRIVATLEKELARMKIKSGFLWGLGAVSSAELMAYDLKTKKYFSKKVDGTYEVISFMAIITKGIDGNITIHPHITLANEKFNCLGGHLKEGTVAATLEVAILESKQKVERYFDQEIGLNLIK
jgi:hypothetical protein